MNNKTPYKGSCLCGKVTFEISGNIKNIIHCHCSLCRRAQGSAFATNGNVHSNEFNFTSGENNLTAYEASPGHTKYFCATCGSPVISKSHANPDNTRVRIGSITTDISEKPEAHIFVSSRANWDTISGDLPQFDTYVPDGVSDPTTTD